MRSKASHYVQGAVNGSSGRGMVSVYVLDGFVFCDFGGIKLKLPKAQAVWLSDELMTKSLLLDATGVR